METTETKEEKAVMLSRILAMPVKRWLFILVLVLIFMALCVVLFTGETLFPLRPSSVGLVAALGLSRQECEGIGY